MFIIMNNEKLNKNNFTLYAMKNYNNPSCSGVIEFYEDMNRIKYIKRLLGRYDNRGSLKHRLVLNHIIILQNMFGAEATTRILFFKIEDKYHSYLKSFLHYLKYLPLGGYLPEVELEKIPTDHKILKILNALGES